MTTIELRCNVCGELGTVEKDMADHFGHSEGDEVTLHADCAGVEFGPDETR